MIVNPDHREFFEPHRNHKEAWLHDFELLRPIWLEDKNKVPLYEGYIVSTWNEEWNDTNYLIAWGQNELMFWFKSQYEGSVRPITHWINNKHKQLEYLWTIYENPELISTLGTEIRALFLHQN
jgi:hypothetical protein